MNSLKRIIAAAAVFAAVVLTAGKASALVLLSDGFETETTFSWQPAFMNFNNWDVTSGTVDIISEWSYWNWFPGYGYYVDLDGSSYKAGTLTSKTNFSLTPGVYTLSFDLAGSQRKIPSTDTVTVSLGSVFSQTYTLPSTAPMSTYSYSITVTSPTTGHISFSHAGGDNVGIILDNVLFEKMAASVPEPSTLLLTASAAAGWLFARRRHGGSPL
ncbi:MAG TPA: PEP-CTERM sorting domain-containing protein [Deltaproteobacteria bacterium]|nr:PEP-CTERM sorting domain-containing protein [Deltaproteobacteria bacterium]